MALLVVAAVAVGSLIPFRLLSSSGGGGGGGGAAFELERWFYTADLRGVTVSGSIGRGGGGGTGGDGGPSPGGSGGSTIINAFGNFPQIVARGGRGGRHADLTIPAGGAGGARDIGLCIFNYDPRWRRG